MPIYEYRCANGHLFEVFQSMSEDPVAACEECGAPVERVFHPVAVHFKGSGFYTTDYAKRKAPAGAGGGDEGGGDSKGDSKAESKAEGGGSASEGGSSGSGSGDSGSRDSSSKPATKSSPPSD